MSSNKQSEAELTPAEKLRALQTLIEWGSSGSEHLSHGMRMESQASIQPNGISVIVPVHNGAGEMDDLLLSLEHQSLDRELLEVVFALNACSDGSHQEIQNFASRSGVRCVILTDPNPSVARARNAALAHASLRYATFVDHDDFISREYLEENLAFASLNSVIVSNILTVVEGRTVEDYAQSVIAAGFETGLIHPPHDIGLCYRAYTLCAIKTAPTYLMRQIKFDESMLHSEDVSYWRDYFHAFLPITIKTPTRRDVYYRVVRSESLSRRWSSFYDRAAPRISILTSIAADRMSLQPDSPPAILDGRLQRLMMDTLRSLSSKSF